MKLSQRLIVTVFGVLAVIPTLQSQNPSAPSVDRVGFPKDYTTSMRVLYVYDRPDNKQVRTIYANDPVFTVSTANQNDYPYGSILVMETWASLKDSQTNPILDSN